MSQADSIAAQAYASWELKHFSEAADLFLEAARVESEEARGRSKWAAPDSSVLHRLRAGFCLFADGKTERALELVKEGMEFDWKSARIWGDRRDAEKCHICFILHSANVDDRSHYNA